MRNFKNVATVFVILASGLWLVTGIAHADGALAIGNCGAFGTAANMTSVETARERAIAECNGQQDRSCRVVTSVSGNCAAFATDGARRCGPWGWARRSTRQAAAEGALEECKLGGGRSCKLRAEVCDVKVPPSMSTNWVATDLPQTECIARAESLMKQAGLTNYEVLGQSVFAEKDDYTAQIRCVAEKSVALFVVAGPNLETARSYMRDIFDTF